MTTSDADFLHDFRSMSEIGATPGGGVDRQAGTPADGRTRNWFRGLVEAHGFQVHYDEIGNQICLKEFVPGAPYVFVGSHLDSQPLGGRYDGAYGVLAAAHAIARLGERAEAGGFAPSYNLAAVNWFNEEGCRFKPSMMGSSVFTGKLDLQDALAITDPDGVTVEEALTGIDTIGSFERPEIAGYAEIHIEQGRSLEDDGLTIGLVQSTWGANKYQLAVHGEQAHTGATVIADRRDALLGAALVVAAAREIANEFSTDEAMVITSCGEFTVTPNSPVVVARRVDLLVDVRCPDAAVLERADAELRRRIDEIQGIASVEIEHLQGHDWPAKAYDEAGMRLAAEVAESLDLPYGEVRTLAGHDSTNMKDVVPTIMLFVPSVEGISHNEREFTEDDDLLAGVAMLTGVLERVAVEGISPTA